MTPKERIAAVFINHFEEVRHSYGFLEEKCVKAVEEAVEEERKRHGVEPLSIEDIRKAVADEREQCAKLLEDIRSILVDYGDDQLAYEVSSGTLDNAIEAIRARK